MRLGEQIAVLDGLGTIDPSGGANYTGGSDYTEGMPLLVSSAGLAAAMRANPAVRRAVAVAMRKSPYLKRVPANIPSSYATQDVINASNGANYSGGSTYPENNAIPLMTSSIGLAGLSAAMRRKSPYLKRVPANIPSSYATQDMINASNGANYSGGSTYPEDNAIPLMTSSIGLAGMAAADRDLMSQSNVINVQRVINASNGANYSGGSAYPEDNAIPLMTSSIGLAGMGVIDPSEGVNWGGGSNYPDSGRWPLLPSSSGLVGVATASQRFLQARQAYRPAVTKGDMWEDAKAKLQTLFASLRGVAQNSKETYENRARAGKLFQALRREMQNHPAPAMRALAAPRAKQPV